MSHRCHAFRCEKEIDPSLLMCLKHWRMVPRNIQDEVWRHYRVGQEIDKRPSVAYLKTQQLAVCAVIVAESGVGMDDAVEVLEGMLKETQSQRRDAMKVSEAKFTRRYNVAQYEHEEYSLTAIVEDDDVVGEVLAELKADVEAAHAGDAPPAKGKKRKGKKKPSSSADESNDDETGDDDTDGEDSETDTDSEEDETEEEDTETDESEDTEDDDESEEEDEEEKPPKKSAKKPAAKKGKAGKKFKAKAQVYQRANEAHKDIFSNVLKSVAPKWKSSFESKALAKKVSQQLEGKEFLDVDGKVVQSFKDLVKKKMAGKK